MTYKHGTGLLFALVITLLSIYPVWAEGGTRFDSPQVSVQLVFDKAAYYLGENVLAHYGITNTGTRDFIFGTGGDYQGAPRQLRYQVTAIDEKGNTVQDPYTNIICFGGLGGDFRLKPGDTFWASLPLLHYCDFSSPGTYTVQVYCDQGPFPYPAAHTRTSPMASGKLTLCMPTAEQAAAVVADMAALPKHIGGILGERRNPYADFSVLRYPIYLPSLLARMQNGDQRALDGIVSIRTPEATRALMNLYTHADRNIADRVLEELLPRLPVSKNSRPLFWANNLRGLSNWCWSEDMTPDMFIIGWRLLASSERQSLIDGAYVIEQLGKPSDLPHLLSLFDRVLIVMKDDSVEQRDYPRPATACSALMKAGEALIARGGVISATDSTAQGILLMCAIKRDPNFRPANWRSTMRILLTHPIPFVRATALANLALPLDPTFIDLVGKLIHDPNPATQEAALDVATRAPVDRFGADALQVLATTRDKWIVQSAFYTAERRGIPEVRVLEVCISRLDDPGMTGTLFEQIMASVFISEHGCSMTDTISADEAHRLKVRWKLFLVENREALQDGKKFPIGVPPITEDLLPAGYHFFRKDGSWWPAQKKSITYKTLLRFAAELTTNAGTEIRTGDCWV